jgi:hypothetical protein
MPQLLETIRSPWGDSLRPIQQRYSQPVLLSIAAETLKLERDTDRARSQRNAFIYSPPHDRSWERR